jgi:TnpA family transposase
VGHRSTAVACDSTHFGAFDQNIFTEWHARYGGRGVLIYWHVERKSMAIHSQLIGCSASEVAAMIEGVIRHGTTMDIEVSYTYSRGQSEIGFGINKAARLRPAAPDQADQQGPAVPPVRRRAQHLAAARTRADPPHPVGPDRRPV